MPQINNTHAIRFLVMDVDGTLTDGKIYMGQTGELFKAFDIRDGFAIKEMLPELGIVPVIITARESDIVANRAKELGITELHQGCHDKICLLKKILQQYSEKCGQNYGLQHIAYIGDDLLDLQCIEPVREAGGITACPADAANEVKQAVNYVCERHGGAGAIREIVELLGKHRNHV